MLTRLKVDGFKNLVGVDVRFGPFTCIAGENGTGKSNLFDAISFLSRLAEGKTLVQAAGLVRGDEKSIAEAQALFCQTGGTRVERMTFEAEMIVPRTATDDLGQEGTAAATFLRYRLELRLRRQTTGPQWVGPLELESELLETISGGEFDQAIGFPGITPEWRDSVLVPSTEARKHIYPELVARVPAAGHLNGFLIHQAPAENPSPRVEDPGLVYDAWRMPKTVLSDARARFNPTVLCARNEMRSWRYLLLDPVALRRPDSFDDEPRLQSNGAGLAATLARLVGLPAGWDFETAMADAAAVVPTTASVGTVACRVANRLARLGRDVADFRVIRDPERQLYTVLVKNFVGDEFPARALSDGTLRFLALSSMEWDPQAPAVICLEEPENGLHPARIPELLRLLADIAVDPAFAVDDDNPSRQVIITTHSPAVVSEVGKESLLWARPIGNPYSKESAGRVEFAPWKGTWRDDRSGRVHPIAPGELFPYVDPLDVARGGEGIGGDNAVYRQREFDIIRSGRD